MTKKAEPFYVTTYCNFPHRLSDGMPINHECRIIPAKALEAEMDDDFKEAIAILESVPASWRRGLKREIED